MGNNSQKRKPTGPSSAGQGSFPSSVFAGRSGRPFVGLTFDVEWIRKIPLSVEKTRNLFNRYNNGESVNRAMDGQPVDPDAGRALVYLFEEAFMAAGGGPPVFNPVYGGAPMGALGGPIGAPTSQHGHVVHHSQAPPQMQSQVGGPPQPVWQQQVLRVPEPNESQQKQRQQQSQGVGKEKKKHAGKRQEKSNATKNGTADEPLATTAPNNPAMRVFPIVLTEMTYDTYISAYEDSQALWQRVFKKHGYDVGEEERQEEEVHREAAPLQSNEPTGNQTPDEDFSTKTKKEENEGNKEGNLMQEDGLSVSPTAENDGKTTEPSKPSCGGAQENPFLQVKGEVEG